MNDELFDIIRRNHEGIVRFNPDTQSWEIDTDDTQMDALDQLKSERESEAVPAGAFTGHPGELINSWFAG